MSDGWKLVLATSTAFLGIGLFMVGWTMSYNEQIVKDCAADWADSPYQSRFKDGSGCQVKIGNHWFPARSVRVN